MEEKAEISRLPSSHKTLGIEVQNLTPEIARQFGVKKDAGIVVTQVEPGSPAAEAGIQTGDIIQQVNRKPVKNVGDFVHKMEKASDKDSVLLLIQRGQSSLFAAVTPK
jgi:serine protease Do